MLGPLALGGTAVVSVLIAIVLRRPLSARPCADLDELGRGLLVLVLVVQLLSDDGAQVCEALVDLLERLGSIVIVVARAQVLPAGGAETVKLVLQ